jgi:AbrB family looped-hinge helix DNA binding protein
LSEKAVTGGGAMSKKSQKVSFCGPVDRGMSCCKVESIVSVDERGQMVLPKDLRDKAKIRAGDKLALISWDKEGEICCLYLIKADSLGERVKDFLGPMMKEV